MRSKSRSPHGNQYLLVIADHFSKLADLIPLRKLVSERVRERLLEAFPRSGFPEQLFTGNASHLTSKVFVYSCRALCIRHKKTTPYHPQSNITERDNRILKSLPVTIIDTHKVWDAYPPEVDFVAR